ncbi:hypothetical protein [Bacillus sp. AFS029533]|uniref:hypothetical protein n=1 Tax=Bacillus sp. AFS029533 TaxID=2033494 RepID=UPI000BFD13CE|nr:hypothetical protein [Bacillus sp. AFS029533]PGZ92191.1 hypothetical protein COE53_12570 [Bacillus sp. AFS029533]
MKKLLIVGLTALTLGACSNGDKETSSGVAYDSDIKDNHGYSISEVTAEGYKVFDYKNALCDKSELTIKKSQVTKGDKNLEKGDEVYVYFTNKCEVKTVEGKHYNI